MKLLILNIKENSELLKELGRHYVADTYTSSIEQLIKRMSSEFELDRNLIQMSGLTGDLYKSFLLVIDKVILHNIFKYMVDKDINKFINLVNNNTLHMDIHITHFYLNQLIEVVEKHLNLTEDEKYSLERILEFNLQKIINEMYVNNTRFLNPVLIKLFDSLCGSVGHINFSYYKFELDQYQRPMIFYNEKESNACLHH